MKKIPFLFTGVALASVLLNWTMQAQAASKVDFFVKVHLTESGELVDQEKLLQEGWKKNEDYGVELTRTQKVTKLPWGFSAGHTSISIGLDGKVSGSSSFGDSDVGCDGETRLFKNGDRFIPTPKDQPYLLQFSGFESASGAYSSDVKVEIWVK